jgi:predicted RNA-binding Zn-ribbon protein involved in translation (DUF1610 family)
LKRGANMSRDEDKKCYSCGVGMHFAGKYPFRVGGTSGGWKLLFGELAELGEEMLAFNVYICPSCGRVELFGDEKLNNVYYSIYESS